MQEILTVPPLQRRQLFKLATFRSGVPPQLLEHDWWQSFVLQSLFDLPDATHFTLHGSRSVRPH